MYMAVSGVSLAGFKIIVQPAATAGPILRVAIPAGKFHGVIRIERPIGSCETRMRLSPDGDLRKSPGVRTVSSANQRKNPAAVLIVEKDNPILLHEIFGPVAPIVIFDTDEEGIEMANDTEFGLISYVFSSNLTRALRTAEAMESGMVAINKGVISDPAAPFGGVKQSGLGREGGFDGIHEFLQTKFIGVEI